MIRIGIIKLFVLIIPPYEKSFFSSRKIEAQIISFMDIKAIIYQN